MKTGAVLIIFTLSLSSAKAQNCTALDEGNIFQKALAQALKDIDTIKPGMTRSDLARLFKPPGGLTFFNRSKTTLVYRGSDHIRVDIVFVIEEAKAHTAESPRDVIKSISRPYLAWPVYD
ncbi:MAG TPA: hypothetical protein VK473_06840 [Terriglobales bacterium]|nr:hypothetical protein [Terriglobales bacterium]